MNEKQFNCVLGKDYHIINNNIDNMTYYLQDGNDVVLVINLMNRLVEENEQLKEEIRAYPINEEYAKEIMQQNQKLRIERNDLRIENEQLKYDNTIFKQIIKHFQKVAQTDKRRLEEKNKKLKSEVEYHKLSCEIKDKNGFNKIVCPSCFSDLKLSRDIAYLNGEAYLEFDCTNCNRSYRIRKGNLYE